MNLSKLIDEHRTRWRDRKFTTASVAAILFFAFTLVVNHLASNYASARQSNHVSDIILDALPVVNILPLITLGTIFLVTSVPILVILEPRRLPFTVVTMALFTLIRACFICMTHTAMPERSIGYDEPFFRAIGLAYTGDLFFSGHTGWPFLLSFIFRERPTARAVYTVTAVVMGGLMLLAHAHYSIDVFAAFFISYSIFQLSVYLFPGTYKMSRAEDDVVADS